MSYDGRISAKESLSMEEFRHLCWMVQYGKACWVKRYYTGGTPRAAAEAACDAAGIE